MQAFRSFIYFKKLLEGECVTDNLYYNSDEGVPQG